MKEQSQVKIGRAAREAANREIREQVRGVLKKRSAWMPYVIVSGTYGYRIGGYPWGNAEIHERFESTARRSFDKEVKEASERADGWVAMCKGRVLVAFYDNKISNR